MVKLICRNLRDDVKQSDLEIDLGPDEQEFKVTDQELQSSQQREISRLRNELRDAEKQIDSLSLKVSLTKHGFHETCHCVTFIVLVNSHQR